MRIASRCELVLILLSIKMIRLAIVAFLSFIGIIPSTPAEKNTISLCWATQTWIIVVVKLDEWRQTCFRSLRKVGTVGKSGLKLCFFVLFSFEVKKTKRSLKDIQINWKAQSTNIFYLVILTLLTAGLKNIYR